MNKLALLPMCYFTAQLVEHRTGIRGEITGSNPVQTLIFSGFFFRFQLFKLKKFTAMIILHFHLQPEFQYQLFHNIFHNVSILMIIIIIIIIIIMMMMMTMRMMMMLIVIFNIEYK